MQSRYRANSYYSSTVVCSNTKRSKCLPFWCDFFVRAFGLFIAKCIISRNTAFSEHWNISEAAVVRVRYVCVSCFPVELVY